MQLGKHEQITKLRAKIEVLQSMHYALVYDKQPEPRIGFPNVPWLATLRMHFSGDKALIEMFEERLEMLRKEFDGLYNLTEQEQENLRERGYLIKVIPITEEQKSKRQSPTIELYYVKPPRLSWKHLTWTVSMWWWRLWHRK